MIDARTLQNVQQAIRETLWAVENYPDAEELKIALASLLKFRDKLEREERRAASPSFYGHVPRAWE
jgi:hypothetical protein